MKSESFFLSSIANVLILSDVGVLLISLVQSAPLTSRSVDTLAQSLMGTVLSYNVTGEPPEQMSPAFGLWTLLEVRTKMPSANGLVTKRSCDKIRSQITVEIRPRLVQGCNSCCVSSCKVFGTLFNTKHACKWFLRQWE